MLSNSLIERLYLRPTSGYNKGKIGEFNERKFFKEPKDKDIHR